MIQLAQVASFPGETNPVAQRQSQAVPSEGGSGESVSRRTVMNMLVSTAAISSASIVPAQGHSKPDPIFALIQAHKDAWQAWGNFSLREDELEASIPKAHRKTAMNVWDDKERFETDDPRWLAFCDEYEASYRATEQAALDLLNVLPTTPQGLAALLHYAYESEAADNMYFPSGIEDVEDPIYAPRPDRQFDWNVYALRSAARAVERLMVSA